ncbi:chromate transporter [Granulicatella sp. zg-ZJ]|uniref:chromate transporter n=1 Tax=unclassified Granulicatella TaxID=2630493 RepID=UPI0013C06FD8|nr:MULTISPECIES: chromate transporter [unclassified Granulicatella]MBS4749746.1 chromate transporter [Carnobacteriaceae bacterium zg-ZUI78]NEW61982.1 chromate transporter [Granulicatella sp. zg-ZJ]NEW65625.1 chromate transporter [Granulicatella sp. zg-84]QMI85734.1 chromate transporter [Carnobacteriaceae bacterium zg-84]
MLWQLFKRTFMISAFTFGGGYVIVPLMKTTFVDKLEWIDEDEMLDLIALAQTAPGAIAVNASVAIGYRMAGVIGAVVTMLATALPPMVILMGMYVLYDVVKTNPVVASLLQGMQVGVCAVILDVVVDLLVGIHKQKSIVSWIVFFGALLLTMIFHVHILMVIMIMTIVGLVLAIIERKWVHKDVA